MKESGNEEEEQMNKTAIILWSLIIFGFAVMELPGIFFINRIEPFIGGFPFIFGFTIIMWGYMCIVLFIAYKLNWGKQNGKSQQ